MLPVLRLRTILLAGRHSIERDAVIDTGAHFSVFPKEAWQAFASEIEWLDVRDVPAATTMGANVGRYRFGRIAATARDEVKRLLGTTPMLAQFLTDDFPADRKPPPILIGLWGSIFEGRRLIRETFFGDAQVLTINELAARLRQGEPLYAQRWWLSDF